MSVLTLVEGNYADKKLKFFSQKCTTKHSDDIYSIIKPGAYIMTKAFLGGLIHGGAYIRGVIHRRKIALRLKVRVFS